MNFNDLLGKTLVSVVQVEVEVEGEDAILFTLDDGRKFKLWHVQDCCESVYIESIVGDLNDLTGTPLTLAEESSNSSEPGTDESETWTFYKLATVKGYVDIRWYGSSNGYYSESVNFTKVLP